MSSHPIPYPPALPADPASRSRLPGDDKAPFDDLIDQYAVSYAAEPVPLAGGRADREPPLYALSHQVSNYSDDSFKDVKTLEGHRTERLDWEYPPAAAKIEPVKQEESVSWWQVARAMLIPDSIACRLYLITVLLETSVDLAMEAELFLRLRASTPIGSTDDQQSDKMPVYLSIFAMAHVFQFAMALDAVNDRNTLQFIALTIFNALFLVYAIIQIGEVGSILVQETSGISIHTLASIVPVVIAVAELAYVGLAWKIYTEFGWKVYKFLGADRRIKSMYTYYQIFLCLVKFDLFFWVGFSVQFIWLVLNKHNAEYYLTCLAFPLSILVLINGHVSARRESKWMMYTFITGCVGALVYFMYKLIKVVRLRETSTFIDVWQTLTTFSVLAIVLLLTTFVFACIVMNNFGRGLANQMAKKQMARRGKSQDLYRGPMRDHPNRMSIE
ncbi:uncharacterized protein B0H18DRAFT_970755 [Fomitopsis serialis]|uniref:uncharacterized protein n=1 Tax=Fomitopsis serialis TaxID=139415 RepID=UPI002008210E|nr:uncharacterized protein B0H18DRAFT_970755 [Neoantrodia serialis]KAH9937463.1 hypothetical protein B0H18DRAFT_970755 [Neoantrodia serialis]